jgi:hypothetical protein
LTFLHKHFDSVHGSSDFSWRAARDSFVDHFSRLALKSQTQVGNHTSRSYADVQAFVRSLSENTDLLDKQFGAQKEERQSSPVKQQQ